MRSSQTITLFAPPPPPPRRGSSPLAVSILLHVVGYSWIFFGLKNTPRITTQRSTQRFTVRILNMPPTQPPRQAEAAGSHAAQTARTTPAKMWAGGPPASMPSVAAQLAQLVPKSQILIQPDAPPDILLKDPTPVPTILRWSPPDTPTKTIVAATLQKPIIAKLRASLEPPNRELTPADFKISSTQFTAKTPVLPPSTTSPVVVRAASPAMHIPETSSRQAEEPAPARIMSLSDLQMKGGPITVPLASAPGRPTVSETLATGPSVNTVGTGQGDPASKQTGSGSSQNAGTADGKDAAANVAPGQGATAHAGAGQGTSSQNGTGSTPGQQDGSGLDLGMANASVTRVHLPKDGQFGIVVVGSSLADRYPETVGLWSSRLVYSVYLHLGSGKAWILQYSLPPAAQAAASGNASRLEAPWPFDIVKPQLDPADFTSDALMIHGFVNLAGRFERLGVVFPAEFPEAKFVLSALQQWQFRPARQNGQLSAVEVLLIIPEETE